MGKFVHNIQKKQHRERSQPVERKKYGFLEKKKDYQVRSKDFHEKQNFLNSLKKKTERYNEDEYYHKMKNITRVENDTYSNKINEVLTLDQVKLLKTQDTNYLKIIRSIERNKIDKQKKDILFDYSGKHVFFIDSKKNLENFNLEKKLDTKNELLNFTENLLKTSQLENPDFLTGSVFERKTLNALNKDKIKKLILLEKTIEREKKLFEVEMISAYNQELNKKGNKKKLKDSNGNIYYKWKSCRKT